MSKKEAHGKGGPGKGGSQSAAPPKTSHPEPTLSKPEIVSLIEKTVSETLSKKFTDLQQELTKFTEQRIEKLEIQSVNAKSTEEQVHALSVQLKNLEDVFQGERSSQTKRIQSGEDTIRDLERRYVLQQEQLKAELEKLQRIQQKVQPELDTGKVEHALTEEQQLASRDAAHQEELTKLHQQHHQDMLSVIDDCCRKLKSGFTRQNKPYDVGEIHVIIDDIKQEMVQEILSEIQKTNTHEDLSSFEEALAKSELSGQLGTDALEERQSSRLTSEDINAAVGAFESEAFDSWSQELTPKDTTQEVEEFNVTDVPVVEEAITRNFATTTGDRGNPYYMEELRRTIDDIIATDAKAEKADETHLTPDLPEEKRSYQDVETSLESMILSDDSAPVNPFVSSSTKDVWGPPDSQILADTSKIEKQPATSTTDVDQLKSLEAMIEADASFNITPPGKSAKAHDQLRSLEGKLENEASGKITQPATSSRDANQLKSLEGKIEGDIQGAAPSKDADQLKSLEAMIEASIYTDKVDGKDKQPVESTTLGRHVEVKANPSGSAVTSAVSREEMHSVHGTGYQENPHYVEEIIKALPTTKEDPKTGKP